jgi:hypothetical protein
MLFAQFRNIPCLIGLVLIFIVALAGVSYGEEGEGDDLPQPYSEEYSSKGRIDRISDNEIVINDCLYKLTPSTIFKTTTMENAQRDSIKEGDFVHFTIDENRKVKTIVLIE